jgi:hypothetical protein
MPSLLSKANSPFKVYQIDHNETIDSKFAEQNPNSFVVQGSGVFKIVNNPLVSCLIPVDDESVRNKIVQISYLPDSGHMLHEKFQDYKHLDRCVAFAMRYFSEIYDEHHSESSVMLMAHPEKMQWRVFVPVQIDGAYAAVTYVVPSVATNKKHKDDDFADKVLSAYAEYDKLFKEGWKFFGTIHSHSSFTAFHSGTDDEDDEENDGLHITIGKVNQNYDFAARLMIRKRSWPYEMKELGLKESELRKMAKDVKINKEFLARFIAPQRETARYSTGRWTGVTGWRFPTNTPNGRDSALGHFQRSIKIPGSNDRMFDPDEHEEMMRKEHRSLQKYSRRDRWSDPDDKDEDIDEAFNVRDAVVLIHKETNEILVMSDYMTMDEVNKLRSKYTILPGEQLESMIADHMFGAKD